LLRRVTLDLTGLPPTPAEVDAFLADRSKDAYERAVDRLLASSRFGEHRARYWLDYVRYADTHGIHFDNYRSIWPYRDYVIRAFNANKPFDRFVREELAGDLLPARTFDDLAATGFMRCNLTTNEGGTITEEVFVNQTRDRVEAFGATFLGLTTGCAACHDHKFDPFSQRDFYGLAAFLSNTVEKPWDLNIAEPLPVLRLPPEETKGTAEVVLRARADLQEKLDARKSRGRELMATWLAAGNRPKPVPADNLELRLRLDEGQGDVVKNSAPGAKVIEFKADTNPLIWGENTWLWPSMRMDIMSRLRLGQYGDVDLTDKFSAGGWIMLRAKPGGGVRTGTGNGSLLARMGDESRRSGAGWDIYQEGTQLIVNLVADWNSPPPAAAVTAATPTASPAVADANAAPATKRRMPREACAKRRLPRRRCPRVNGRFKWQPAPRSRVTSGCTCSSPTTAPVARMALRFTSTASPWRPMCVSTRCNPGTRFAPTLKCISAGATTRCRCGKPASRTCVFIAAPSRRPRSRVCPTRISPPRSSRGSLIRKIHHRRGLHRRRPFLPRRAG
jgi:hypothetical protein